MGSVAGLAESDSLSSVDYRHCGLQLPATASSDPGPYAITGSGLEVTSANYVSVIGQAPANATALTITAPPTPPTRSGRHIHGHRRAANAGSNIVPPAGLGSRGRAGSADHAHASAPAGPDGRRAEPDD